MRTDKMTILEILNAYYYISSKFVKKKLQTKYGRWFLLNPYFYFDRVFKIKNKKDFFSKLKIIFKLLKRLFKQKISRK